MECRHYQLQCPHSLGKSVEWKPIAEANRRAVKSIVPTRWGNQLNGNTYEAQHPKASTPSVPTRWGNQLNGNPV